MTRPPIAHSPSERGGRRPSGSWSPCIAESGGVVHEAVAPVRRLHHLTVVAAMATVGAVIAGATQPAEASEDGTCRVSDEEYTVVASVAVRNTMFGAANGVYPMGSGKLTLHIDDHAVKLTSYELVNHLTVRAKVAMLSTTVVTASRTSTAGDCCRGSARGTLNNSTLSWNSAVSGYHSDGSLTCSGSMCGKFGAPPTGTSPLHDAPAAMTFNPFSFSPDGSTFTMPYVLVSQSNSPKQKTYLALAGRRVRRTCVVASVPTCCGATDGRGAP
jgi:hypothetical protein